MATGIAARVQHEFVDAYQEACPACGSSRKKGPAGEQNGRAICVCADCQLRFSVPMISADSDWYASSWFSGQREATVKSFGVDRPVPWNFAQALSMIESAPRGKLLDVGCAEGQFLYLARKMGFDVTGLDFNPVSLRIARDVFGISSVYRYSVEELAERFPGACFDVVTMFEVLEHTADPLGTLKSLTKVVKPGGVLLLSVPGWKRWPALFHPEVDSPPHHLTLWTEEALAKILQRVGLSVRTIARKPLSVDDFGVHIKWRVQGMLRRFKSSSKPAQNGDGSSEKNGRHGTCSSMLRALAKGALLPVCAVLGAHPRSGGFTLFASAQKS
jgi:2-polyprenyl-3-methyl-5-hydroxy-6-metoxy-1,4-benzoquinol methylase